MLLRPNSRSIPADRHSYLTNSLFKLKACDDPKMIKRTVAWGYYQTFDETFNISLYRAESQCLANIRHRCYSPSNKQYADYGGKGVQVCEPWLKSFWFFYRDMGPRPLGDGSRKAEYSIDRIDNDGNYTKPNCRWTTRTIQQNNQSRSRVKRVLRGETCMVSTFGIAALAADESNNILRQIYGAMPHPIPQAVVYRKKGRFLVAIESPPNFQQEPYLNPEELLEIQLKLGEKYIDSPQEKLMHDIGFIAWRDDLLTLDAIVNGTYETRKAE